MVCSPSDAVCILTNEGWLPLGMIALFTSFMLVSIGYMLSKGFHLPKLEAWARSEYREVLISAVIISALAFGVSLIDALNAQFSEGQPVFATAYSYLDNSADSMMEIYGKLLVADRYIAKMSSFYFNVAIPLFLASATFSQSPRGGMSILSTMIAAGLDALSTSVFLQMAQKVLLQFFEQNSFRLLLPLGIVLRTFALSRKLGSTLIAIAIGTYVVYPLCVVFASQIYAAVSTPVTINLPAEPPDLQDTMICNPFVTTFMSLGSTVWWFIWFSAPCALSVHGWWACMEAAYPAALVSYDVANKAFLLASAPALLNYATMDLGAVYEPIRDQALPAIATNAMLTAVLAVFSIIITVSSTRALSAELGGDTQFYGIYKLI